LTDENAARGSLGRGGGVEASTAAASPAVPLPGPLGYARALLGTHLAALRAAWRDADRGASAVELAVITAIILAVALALLLVIKNFVHTEASKIHG
jgi:Flp pilus assembly pilin Flp